jgi:hypothetical protein
LCAIAGVWTSVGRIIRFREAALDLSVIVAAGAATATAVVGQQLEGGFTLARLVAAGLPLMSIISVMLIGSAGFGHWQGLPLSIGLIAVGQVFITFGNLLFGYLTAQNAFTDDRWVGLLWFCGAIIFGVAALIVICRLDRPIRLLKQPREAVSPRALLIGAGAALTVTAAVVAYGIAAEHQSVVIAGLAAGTWIGAAMTLRAWSAMRRLEGAITRLDEALCALEATRDELQENNAELATKNVQLRAADAMFSELLVVANERSHGALWALIEDTGGDDLARLLARYLGR